MHVDSDIGLYTWIESLTICLLMLTGDTYMQGVEIVLNLVYSFTDGSYHYSIWVVRHMHRSVQLCHHKRK